MRTVKFLHCADIHLDMPFTSLGVAGTVPHIRRQELKETFIRIVDTAEEEQVDLLLISGDLFEHDYVKKSTINFINDKFNKISRIKVFLIPGNHDPNIPNSYYRNYKWSSNVSILTEENPHVHLEDIDASIYGIGFKNQYDGRTFEYCIKTGDPQSVNILLAHGTVDLNFNRNSYNPMSSQNLSSLDMDYIALGHFHNRLEGIGERNNIYNPGSPEPLGFDEPDGHGVFIGNVTISDSGKKSLDVRFLELGKRYYKSFDVDVDGANNDEQLAQTIHSFLGESEVCNGIFCITLKGYTEKGYKPDLARLTALLKESVFYLKIKDETEIDYNFEEIIRQPGLKGLYVRKIFDIIRGSEDEYEKKMLIRALYYGLEALERGRVDV